MRSTARTLFVSSLALTSSMLLAQEQSAIVKSAVASPWGASYYMETQGPNADLSEINFDSAHLLSLKYKLGFSDASLGAVIYASSAYGKDKKATVQGEDHYLKFVVPSLFATDLVSLSSDVRLYAPTSQKSQEKNLAFRLNPRLIASSSLGNTELSYMLSPTYYAYQKDQVGNTRFVQGHLISASYNVTPAFSVDGFFYPEWKHSGPVKDVAYNSGNIGAGISGKVGENLKLSTWAEGYNVGVSAKATRIAASFDVKML